ncbi:MAG: T9SS type A sorting domain-containing protein [Candidatus Aegiribacteria sp.]|nr:T9SS type A sorting domain-containing protein [Candidatus Aegiribacteria sp.]
MYQEELGEYGFNVNIVKPDGSYIDHSFETPYPVGDYSYDQFWYGNVCSFLWPILSPDSRYFWMTGGTIDMINFQSTAFAYCVDSETGARIDGYELCTGYCFGGPKCFLNSLHNEEYMGLDEKGSIYHSWSEVLDIDSIGAAQIRYGHYEVMGDTSCVVDTISLPPPSDRNCVLSGDMCCGSDIRTDAEKMIKILSNPVRETLDVRLVGESGEDFELILYDITGRRVLSESCVNRDDESVLNIRVGNLPSGVYLLKIRSGSFETIRTISIVR